MHRTKKSHESKDSFSTFYISVPNIRALGPIIFFSKTDSVPLRYASIAYRLIDAMVMGIFFDALCLF